MTWQDLKVVVKMMLLSLNVIVWVMLLIFYVLMLDSDSSDGALFEMAAYIWSALIVCAACMMMMYHFFVGNVLWSTSSMVREQSFADKERMAMKRLLGINGFIMFYFVFQAFTTIYLATDSEHQSVRYSLIYLFVDAVCLIAVSWLYRASLHRLIENELAQNAKKQRQRAEAQRAPRTPSAVSPSEDEEQQNENENANHSPYRITIANKAEQEMANNLKKHTVSTRSPVSSELAVDSDPYHITVPQMHEEKERETLSVEMVEMGTFSKRVSELMLGACLEEEVAPKLKESNGSKTDRKLQRMFDDITNDNEGGHRCSVSIIHEENDETSGGFAKLEPNASYQL